MWPPHSFFVQFTVFLLLDTSVSAALTNTTVDDADSSFTFSGSWTAVSPADPCGGCASKPDPAQTYQQTWHNGHYKSTDSELTGGSFTFTGSAVYIFGIDQVNTQPKIVFTLGNSQFTHHYTGSARFAYHALLFSATELSGQTQTVSWVFEIDPDTGVDQQVALFDYAIVTSGSDDADNTPTKGQGSTSTTNSADNGNLNNVTTPPSAPTTPTSTLNESSPPFKPTSSPPTGGNQPTMQTLSSESQTNPSSNTPPPASTETTSGVIATQSNSGASLQGSPNSKFKAGMLVGSILGVLFFCAVAGLAACSWRRRRHRKRTTATQPEPAYLLLEAMQSSVPLNAVINNEDVGGSQISPLSEKSAESQSTTTSASPISPNTSSLGPSDSAGASQPTARERLLEDRVAQLEARIEMAVTDVQPPPYAYPD